MAFKTVKSSVEKANRTIKDQWGQANGDPYRPVYHPIAPHGWMNDPNGLIYDKGWYHVFYQWNPYGSGWGNIHWGHMRTKDFASWQHMSTALAPEKSYEKDGCFSGSAVADKGELVLVYTANVFKDGNHPYNDGPLAIQSQAAARSKDGIHFLKEKQNPLIANAPNENALCDFRDPKVWKEGHTWYMVLGWRDGAKAEILQYRSVDLLSWELDSKVLTSDGMLGYMWECPDLFKLNNQRVLMFSPMGVPKYDGRHVSGYIVQSTDFIEEAFKLVDYGPHFYAPQTFEGEDESRIMIGWVPMFQMNSDKHNWCGCLTLPRELKLSDDDELMALPSKKMKLRKTLKYGINHYKLDVDQTINMAGDTVHLCLKVDIKEQQAFRIKLKASEDLCQYTEIVVDPVMKRVILDWSKAGVANEPTQPKRHVVYDFEHINDETKVGFQIFIDKSVVELYGFDGRCVMTAAILSNPENKRIQISSRSKDILIEELRMYQIEPSVNDLCLGE